MERRRIARVLIGRKEGRREREEKKRDGQVQRGAEEEESAESREEESSSRRPIHWEAEEQAPAPLYLRQAQAQALKKMA